MRAVRNDRAEAIVLGCAGMAALAARLSRDLDVPVVDGVAAAVKLAEALVALGLRTSKQGSYASPRRRVSANTMGGLG
jgi:allantoin racemase